MKPLRWFYYLIMSLCLVFGMYSGLRVYYIVFFAQLFVVLSVVAVGVWTVCAFKYKQELSHETCVKGKEVTLRLEIHNEKPFPLSLIEASVEVVSRREKIRLVFSLAPYSGKTFEIPVSTPYRGRFKIGMTKLKITDVFGLVSFPFNMRWLSFYRMCELVVLPRAHAPGTVSADIADTKLFGDAYLKQAETGDSVSGARPLRDGDALKRVHWKKSAQQGELFVKQFEFPERERVMIMVDTAVHGLFGEEALVYADTVCECAASIALQSLSRNRTVRVINSADFGVPSECASLCCFEAVRRHLALLPFVNEADLCGALLNAGFRGERKYELFVITRGGAVSTQFLERILAAFRSVTLINVGGQKTGGYINTIHVEPGSDAAQSLRGLL